MTQLNYLRRRFKDAAAAHEAATAERDRFGRSKWLSRTAWSRMGYALRAGEASDIEFDFPTPWGTASYEAFHAYQVELRPGVWRKMVGHNPIGAEGLNRELRSHRAEVHAALVAAGEGGLADRLRPSLVTRREYDEDRARFDSLEEKCDQTKHALTAAKTAYEEVWLPVVERREETQRRRDLSRDLAELGVEESSLLDGLSVAELECLLRRKRDEVQRQADLAELANLGVDLSTLPADLPSEDLTRLVERRRRQADPIRVSRVLRMNGIDPDRLPPGIDTRDVLGLVEGGGYLGTVPSGLSGEEKLADLRSRGRWLAAWACQHYPAHVKEEPCFLSPGRAKLMFRKPARAETRRRHRGRSRRRGARDKQAPPVSWRQFGF